MSYSQSTQAREWLFSSEELFNKKRKIYDEAVFKYGASLSFEEYLKYIQFYADELIRMGNMMRNWNRFHKFTALMFYQRIYINKSIWDVPPEFASINCIFLVSKFVMPSNLAEVIQEICPREKINSMSDLIEKVSKNEIVVLDAIKFHLKIHLPFNLISAISNQQLEMKVLEDAVEKCKDLLMNEALLLYPPGQIAAASLVHVIGIEKVMELLPTPPEDISSIIESILNLESIHYTQEEISAIEMMVDETSQIVAQIAKASDSNDYNPPKAIVPP